LGWSDSPCMLCVWINVWIWIEDADVRMCVAVCVCAELRALLYVCVIKRGLCVCECVIKQKLCVSACVCVWLKPPN